MKNRTFVNKTIAILTALVVTVLPMNVFASEENLTEEQTIVLYGNPSYYSMVVPTCIELNSIGIAKFDLRVEGELKGWYINTSFPFAEIRIPSLCFFVYSEDEEGVSYPGCYLYQEGKEPIFAEFHEEVNTIYWEKYMEQEGITNYKDVDSPCYVYFCNPLPNWVRNLEANKFPTEYVDYSVMTQEQFSHFKFGYDMGTTVPITVNLEGNKPVPAGEWKGEIIIAMDFTYNSVPKNICGESTEAYNDIVANHNLNWENNQWY